jgi:hypothetical protein
MLEPFAWVFGDFLTRLIIFEVQLQCYARRHPGAAPAAFLMVQATGLAEIIETKARKMELESVFQKAERIRVMINQPWPSAESLAGDIAELRDRLQDALKSRAFLEVPPNLVNYYNARLVFGQAVVNKFPKLNHDLAEAGKCFSLGRDTACVFHLMRVMEHGVQRLGTKLRVKINPMTEPWHKILCHVNKQIGAMPIGTTRQKKKQARYAGASAHLDNVRIAWRNEVMHPKAQYSPLETRDIIGHVAIFMKDLADLV